MLVRGDGLARAMSDYLVSRSTPASPSPSASPPQLVAAHGAGQLERLTLRDARTGATETVPAAALFILIGAQPHGVANQGAAAR